MTANTTFDRSDKIRQRRNQRSQERVVRATNVVHTPRTARNPTVTVRGNGMGRPMINRATTQPRRKYYVALDAAGAELAMPALPMIRPGWRLFSGLIVIAMVVLLIVVSTSSAFQVKSPHFTGLQRLGQADVEAVMDLKGTSIVMVDPNALRTKLEAAFPELSAVAVNVSLPASVNVTVRERQPVMAWKIKDVVTWIDAEGVRFSPHGDAAGLVTIESDDNPPLVQTDAAATDTILAATANTTTAIAASADGTATTAGAKVVQNSSSQRVDMKILKAAILLGSQMPEKSVLVYNYLNGLGWTDPRGWKVYFGLNLDDIEPKFIMYETIVDQLTQKKITPAVISVENINAPFYRLEP
jgi:cell division protein FtsQ